MSDDIDVDFNFLNKTYTVWFTANAFKQVARRYSNLFKKTVAREFFLNIHVPPTIEVCSYGNKSHRFTGLDTPRKAYCLLYRGLR